MSRQSKLRESDQRRILKEQIRRLEAQVDIPNLLAHSFPEQLNFIQDPSTFKSALCTRRAGKCIEAGTLIATPRGPIAIEYIKPGDYVYSEAGTPIRVLETFDNGVKEVAPLMRGNRKYVAATLDHIFLTIDPYASGKTSERAIKNFTHRSKIVRTFVHAPLGPTNEPHAYVLGALLGDGCSRQGVNQLHISSQDDAVPKRCAEILGCEFKRNSSQNYTWHLYHQDRSRVMCAHYDGYCANRYAHQKAIDINLIKSWNRKTLLSFVAGLLDTDGSVGRAEDNTLSIRWSMQSKSAVDAIEYAFLALWQAPVQRGIDVRTKYVHGPCYTLNVKSNLFAVRALKELTPYLATPHKQWQSAYNTLKPHNDIAAYAGFNVGETYQAHTYDLHVDSKTNLYLTAHGLVTHNSYGCGLYLFHEALTNPGRSCLYIGLTKEAARRTINKDVFERIKNQFNIKARYNESKYTWEFDNGSEIYLTGANANSQEMDKIRGLSLSLVIVDESSKYKQSLQTLVYDILVPCIADYNGTIVLIGTPGNAIQGLFYDATNNLINGWSNHHWTWKENPFKLTERLKTHQNLLTNDPLIIETPGYKQEWLGKWIIDFTALVYRFDSSENSRNRLAILPHATTYEYMLAIDFGANDPTALVVLAYSQHDPHLYIIDQYKFPSPDPTAHDKYESYIGVTEVVDKIREFERQYSFSRYIADPASAQVIAEMKKRHNIPIESAEKVNKADFIHYMNDDFISGKIIVVGDRCEPLVDEWEALIWDETIRLKSGRRIEKASLPNHLSDACLYGWRAARNYLATPEAAPKPLPHSVGAVDLFWERESERVNNPDRHNNPDDDLNLNPDDF